MHDKNISSMDQEIELEHELAEGAGGGQEWNPPSTPRSWWGSIDYWSGSLASDAELRSPGPLHEEKPILGREGRGPVMQPKEEPSPGQGGPL